MRRLLAVALVVGATGATAAEAQASLTSQYQHAYWKCVRVHHHSRTPCGRNIINHGAKYPGKRARTATKHEKAKSLRQLRRLNNPRSAWGPPPQPPGQVASYYGTLPPLKIAECESGGSYSAQNPSGARGRWQLMPGTYAAYGGDGSWSPADQDRVAARLYAAEGTGPWVASQGCWG